MAGAATPHQPLPPLQPPPPLTGVTAPSAAPAASASRLQEMQLRFRELLELVLAEHARQLGEAMGEEPRATATSPHLAPPAPAASPAPAPSATAAPLAPAADQSDAPAAAVPRKAAPTITWPSSALRPPAALEEHAALEAAGYGAVIGAGAGRSSVVSTYLALGSGSPSSNARPSVFSNREKPRVSMFLEVTPTVTWDTSTYDQPAPDRSFASDAADENSTVVLTVRSVWRDVASSPCKSATVVKQLSNLRGRTLELIKHNHNRGSRAPESGGESGSPAGPAPSRQMFTGGFVLHPSGRPRMIWDMLGIFFLFLDLVMIPLLAFGDYVKVLLFEVMGLCSSTYWALDLAASFFVGYHNQAGAVELSPRRVAIRYARTWLPVDALLVLSDWAFIVLGGGQQNASFLRIGKSLSRGIRVMRLLRIVRMHGVLSNLLERVRSEYVRTIFNICGLVFFIIMVNHFIACGWYLLGAWSMEDGSASWVRHNLDHEGASGDHASFAYRYTTALHWSLTQFTPASMEVVPQNSLERIFTVVVLIFALVCFSSFVSSITQSMTHLRAINAQRLAQQAMLRRYLNQHGISGKLINRVWHYLNQRQVVRSCTLRTKEQDVQILQLLPKSIRIELRFEAHAPEITKHPFFYHYGFAEPSALREICHEAIAEMSMLSRQELYSEGKGEAVQMLFIVEGLLEYRLPCACPEHGTGAGFASGFRGGWVSEDELEALEGDRARTAGYVDQIRPGQWACEAALWAERVELCGPLVAAQKSEVLLVKPAEFQEIVMRHEGSKTRVAKYAETFTEFVGIMTTCRWRAVICNDYSTVEDLVHRVFDYELPEEGRSRHHRTRIRYGVGLPQDTGGSILPGSVRYQAGFMGSIIGSIRIPGVQRLIGGASQHSGGSDHASRGQVVPEAADGRGSLGSLGSLGSRAGGTRESESGSEEEEADSQEDS